MHETRSQFLCSQDSLEKFQISNIIEEECCESGIFSNEEIVNYSGRPPWYDSLGRMKEAYVIGLCGGSASGKTTVAKALLQRINQPWVIIQSLDSFYKVLTPECHEAATRMEYDFDHPSAIDHILAAETLKRMKLGKPVDVPIYDFTTHSRVANKKTVIYGGNVIIVEGLLTLYYEEIGNLLDLKIYIDTDSDLRLCRRIKRDIEERGRKLPDILLQYSRFVKPNFEKYVAPQLSQADIVIPWDNYNYSGVDMIVKLIKRNLANRGILYRSELFNTCNRVLDSKFENFHLIKQTKLVYYLNTIMRNSLSDRESFCKASQRLMKLCITGTLSLVYFPASIEDIESVPNHKNICAVSIMRAGEAFENSIRDILYDYSFGKILIQTNTSTQEPEFHHLNLPNDIKNNIVLLFDATIATGAAAIMAIRILIDHEVEEQNIYFTTLILTPVGIKAIKNVFPKVKIVSAAIDNYVNDNYHIIPGVGNFRERYFGC